MSSCIISLQSENMISCHSKRNFIWGNPWRFPGINTVKGISNSMPCRGRAIHLVFDFIVLNVDKNVPRMRMRMRTGRARAAVGVVIVRGKNVPSFLWTIHFEGINYAFSFHCAWVVGCQLSPRPGPPVSYPVLVLIRIIVLQPETLPPRCPSPCAVTKA